jgi:hypothetical protein
MPTKAAKLKRTRAQRIPFRPGDRYSNKGRIHSRRPILSSAFFACKTTADHTFRMGGSGRDERGSYILHTRRFHGCARHQIQFYAGKLPVWSNGAWICSDNIPVSWLVLAKGARPPLAGYAQHGAFLRLAFSRLMTGMKAEV